MTEAQLAVMEPPYNTRLDRPCVEEDGSVKVTSRAAVKKDFDKVRDSNGNLEWLVVQL